MTALAQNFDEQGYAVFDGVVGKEALIELEERVAELQYALRIKDSSGKALTQAGTRNLLRKDWVRALAAYISGDLRIAQFLPQSLICLQCNYFFKTVDVNWHVALHQDLSVPVESQFASKGWGGWSLKEGELFVQPPKEIIKELVIARLHIENTCATNGALEVVPGSHKASVSSKERVLVPVEAGGVMLMRPLLMHGSRKIRSGTRNVLHFVFAPRDLNIPGQWPQGAWVKNKA